MSNINYIYFQESKLESVIEIKDIVAMRYYGFQNDVIFNKPEVHNFWEFVYVDKGQIKIIADDNCFTLMQGEMVFHKPGQAHDLFGDGIIAPNVLVGCFFCDSEAMNYFQDKIVSINKRNKELLSSIVYESKNAFVMPPDNIYRLDSFEMEKKKDGLIGAQQLLKINLEEFLIRLIRDNEFVSKYERSKSMPRDNFESDFVEEIIAYMKKNLDKRIKRSDFCHKFNVSITSMETAFKKIKGQPVMRYFTKLKIEEAKRMIRENAYNFTEISEMLGFSTPHYFSTVFKKTINMTPSEYANSIKAIIDDDIV